jgi:phenylalanyl-tRNA synthetase alpha chain
MAENIDHILKTLKQLDTEFQTALDAAKNEQAVQDIKVEFLAKKGRLTALFPLLGKVDPRDRPTLGSELNRIKTRFQEQIETKLDEFQAKSKPIEDFDPTLPGRRRELGGFHPLLQVLDDIKTIFKGMGFRVENGPEIESEYHNFVALNIPESHPSRDMQDTFYLADKRVLRTHTSPVQVRTMEAQHPPVRMIAPGRCFRKDTPDATHSPTFHQVEGLVVDKNVTFADLKGVVQAFAEKLMGKGIKVRFRPSFFPFTEPSAEYDFSCIFCKGKGCRVCKQTGWLEISGAGMVDPAVFGFVDYDPEVYSGYAFGMGVERIALLKYQIDDIRIFFDNDYRFLKQF